MDWSTTIILIFLAIITFVAKRYIDSKFKRNESRFSKEFDKKLIQAQAAYDYKQFAVKESFHTTVEAYRGMVLSRKYLVNTYVRPLDSDRINENVDKIKDHLTSVVSNQILMDSNIYVVIIRILNTMISIPLLLWQSVPVPPETLRDLENDITLSTELFRQKYSIELSAEHIIRGVLDIPTQNQPTSE